MEQLVLKPTSQIRRLRFRKMMRFTQYPPASTCRHQFWTRRAPRLCTTLRDVGSFQNKNQTHKYKLVAAGGGPVGKIDQEVPTSSCEKSFLSKEHWRTRSSRHCSTGPKIEHHSQRIRFRDPAWGAGQSRSWSGKVLALRPAPAIYLLVQGDRPPPSVRTPALLATEPAHGKRVGIGETVRTSKRHTQLSRCDTHNSRVVRAPEPRSSSLGQWLLTALRAELSGPRCKEKPNTIFGERIGRGRVPA